MPDSWRGDDGDLAVVAATAVFDGRRMLMFTPHGPGGRVLLQTRRGTLVQDPFPDPVAVAEQWVEPVQVGVVWQVVGVACV
ncbi:hypothetical protein [Streptomyces sp. NPDC001568]|uniref:hypothetical protein n=1 Tax=Streptomyces sp. NPDC001568 TaxID=3364588 RepID=UPI003686BA1D